MQTIPAQVGHGTETFLPAVDVGAADGWIGTDTFVRRYQQADEATMLAVVLGGGDLRERKA